MRDVIEQLKAQIDFSGVRHNALVKARDFLRELEMAPGVSVEMDIRDQDDQFSVDLKIQVQPDRPTHKLPAPNPKAEREPKPTADCKPVAALARAVDLPAEARPAETQPRKAVLVDDGDGLKRGPWSPEELDHIRQGLADGTTQREIARQLGRPAPATAQRIRKLREEGDLDVSVATEKAEAETSLSPEVTTAVVPPIGSIEEWEKHLKGVASDEWTDQEDLVLVEGIDGGRLTVQIAQEINRTVAELRARYEVLVPRGPGDVHPEIILALKARLAKDQT